MARALVAASSHYLEKGAAILTAVPLSMACWYRPVATNVTYGLMKQGTVDTDNHKFALAHLSSNAVMANTKVGGGTDSSAVSSTGATAGVWTHACGVWAAINSRAAYINGGSKGTETTSRTPTAPNRTLLGAWYAAAGTKSGFLNGDIAEAAIWNLALTDADVAMLATGISPLSVRPEGLVGYWPLLGAFSPEIDIRGRNELTVSGATQAAHCRVFYPRKDRLTFDLTADVTVAVTGVAVTGAVGTDVPSSTLAPSGIVGTASLGSVTNSASVAVSGVNSTGSVGSVVFSQAGTLAGVEGTGSVGSVAFSQAGALTGAEATGSVGSVAQSFSVSLTGEGITGEIGTVTASAESSFDLAGVSVGITTGTVTATTTSTAVLTSVFATGQVGSFTAIGPVQVGSYRHIVRGPINGGRPQRLKTLERVFERMERKS